MNQSSSENLCLYEKVRAVPDAAQRPISGGSLKGKTDINPMWRIKTLTEQFGICGFGWKTTTDKQWLEVAPDGRIAAFCNITLYVKVNGEWSEGIQGNGGSMFVDFEHDKQRASDECYKMAYTDALSVCCKLLGIGADVYWEKDKTKYTNSDEGARSADPPKPQDPPKSPNPPKEPEPPVICEKCNQQLKPYKDDKGNTVAVKKHADNCKEKFGHIYCLPCLTQMMANGEVERPRKVNLNEM